MAAGRAGSGTTAAAPGRGALVRCADRGIVCEVDIADYVKAVIAMLPAAARRSARLVCGRPDPRRRTVTC